MQMKSKAIELNEFVLLFWLLCTSRFKSELKVKARRSTKQGTINIRLSGKHAKQFCKRNFWKLRKSILNFFLSQARVQKTEKSSGRRMNNETVRKIQWQMASFSSLSSTSIFCCTHKIASMQLLRCAFTELYGFHYVANTNTMYSERKPHPLPYHFGKGRSWRPKSMIERKLTIFSKV